MLDEETELEEPALNEIQQALADLEGLGWTLAAIADELTVTQNAVQKWKAGQRTPRPLKPILVVLESLAHRKSVPKKRRYGPGSRLRHMAEVS
jgi:transcriptional regulator with XRE-family HTH domain